MKQTVDSLKAKNGEPVYNRKWNAETMGPPNVEYSEPKRPSLKANATSDLISGSCGQEQTLYVLLAATGMGISEAQSNFGKSFALRKNLVDVTGIEPVTPCLQSRPSKPLNALTGVAYMETDKILALSNVPKLYRARAEA